MAYLNLFYLHFSSFFSLVTSMLNWSFINLNHHNLKYISMYIFCIFWFVSDSEFFHVFVTESENAGILLSSLFGSNSTANCISSVNRKYVAVSIVRSTDPLHFHRWLLRPSSLVYMFYFACVEFLQCSSAIHPHSAFNNWRICFIILVTFRSLIDLPHP